VQGQDKNMTGGLAIAGLVGASGVTLTQAGIVPRELLENLGKEA
jgi:hypothetical protein